MKRDKNSLVVMVGEVLHNQVERMKGESKLVLRNGDGTFHIYLSAAELAKSAQHLNRDDPVCVVGYLRNLRDERGQLRQRHSYLEATLVIPLSRSSTLDEVWDRVGVPVILSNVYRNL